MDYMRRVWIRFRVHILRLLAVLTLALLVYSFSTFNWKSGNFGEVEEGVLYRSEKPGEAALRRWVRDYNLKTLVVLSTGVAEYEKRIAKECGIAIYHIRMSARRAPTEEQIAQFLTIMDDVQNHSVLVHCRAGADRTGVMVALYRIERQGWSVKQAQKEMWRYKNILPRYRNFIEQRYRAK